MKKKKSSSPSRTSVNELRPEQLRWTCDPRSVGVKSTKGLKPSKEIIGQDRALRALQLGLEMKHPGYNVFVTGYSGTGRMTTIKRLLEEVREHPAQLNDRCYVHNFRNPDQPVLITLKGGEGRKLKDRMEDFLRDLQRSIPSAFESRRYQEERKRLVDLFQDRQRSVLKGFEKKVKEKGFEVVQVQSGTSMRPDIAPVVENQPVNFDQLDQLVEQGTITKEQVEKLMNERALLENAMELMMREMRNIERKAKESLDDLIKRFLLPIVKDFMDDIRRQFAENKEMLKHLDGLQDHIMEDPNRFRTQEEQTPQIPGLQASAPEEDNFVEFGVNVVLDNSGTKGAPIIIETNPKFKNIFGTIEREVDRHGVWKTDFTMIKAGSLLQADGGYLVINALDALVEPGVWQTLKRTLRYGLLEIQPIETGLFGTSFALKPEPIKLDVKVVMIGDAYIYSLLYEQDDDFKKIFKVRADFDVEMQNTAASMKKYVSFISMICEDDHLLPIDNTGIAAVVEFGVRMSGRQNKLSTRFNLVADVLREANYWSTKESAKTISAGHVRKAIAERIDRVRMTEDKIQEMIMDGTIMIDTETRVTGQINGLSVYDMGEYMFGKPSRITAKTAMGRKGVINIEREAQMSGPTHNKGVLILGGYLNSMYAQDKPLVMTATVAFEQSYGGVDGDSASSTEIYAILSSLSGIALRQDIAVTGSVNQNGEVQAIGGVNQKIEGFFDVCRARGLTGRQGVLIPRANVPDLMLRHDVIETVRKGQFHVYAVSTIDEGIEILTGIPAGNRDKNNRFPEGTVHCRVDSTLAEHAKRWSELSES
jgi:ATP-dependent Lon protease